MLQLKNAAVCEAAASERQHQCCSVRASASMMWRESNVNAAACMLLHKYGGMHAEA